MSKFALLKRKFNTLLSLYKEAGLLRTAQLIVFHLKYKRRRQQIIKKVGDSFSKGVALRKEGCFILWGCNDFSAQLHKMMSEWGLSVSAFIDPDYNADSFCKVPVIPYNKIEDRTLPIIVATPHKMSNLIPVISQETIEAFPNTVYQIKKTLNVENEILHACALIDFISIDCTGKILTFGRQGSGNTIYSHIIQYLYQTYRDAFVPNNISLYIFEQLAFEYTQIATKALHFIESKVEATGLAVGPWQFKTGSNNMLGPNNIVLHIVNNPSRHYLCHSSYGYHKMPPIDMLQMLHEQNYKMYLVIRNPLDILVSHYNKQSSYTGHSVEDLVKNMEGLIIATTFTIDCLNSWLDRSKYLDLLYYEDLIDAPVTQIQKISQALGVGLSKQKARKMWEKLGFRQLPGATKGHFQTGGKGKWKTAFSDEQLACFKYFEFDKIVRRCGYEKDADELCNAWQDIDHQSYTHQYANIIQAMNAYRRTNAYINYLEGQSCDSTDSVLFPCNSSKAFACDTTIEPLRASKVKNTEIVLSSYDKELFLKAHDVVEQEPIRTVLTSGTHSYFQPQ
jgi:hypothetical protein